MSRNKRKLIRSREKKGGKEKGKNAAEIIIIPLQKQ